jgi:hypothetical protein
MALRDATSSNLVLFPNGSALTREVDIDEADVLQFYITNPITRKK